MTAIEVRRGPTVIVPGQGGGAKGDPGPPGPGVPAGGSDGDVMVKVGTTPYEFATTTRTALMASFNITDPLYGAVGGGADDSTAINAAITAASAVGGRVVFPPGTWLGKNLAAKLNVTYSGAGLGTIVKLLNGANTDLFISDSFSSLTGGTTAAGPTGFRFENMVLDGNRANNTSGWPLRLYASNYSVDGVHIREGKSGGVWTQWGAGGTNMEAHWSNFKVYNCEGVLLDHNGPHDSIFVNGSVFNDSTQPATTGTLIYAHGQSSGSQFTNVHAWGNCSRGIDVINATFFSNCQTEGATVAEVRFQTNYSQWVGGHIFGTTTGTEIGVEFGVAAVTSAKGNTVLGAMFSRFGSGSFPIKYTNTAGSNVVTGQIATSVTATAVSTGTPNTTVGSEDRIEMRSASPSTLVSDWAIPKTQAKRLWVPASRFAASTGTPALNANGFWLLDPGTVENVVGSLMLPSWWNTCNVVLHWANGGAGTGDVRWAFRYDFIDAGQTVGTYSSLFQNAVTAGAQDVVVETTLTGTVTNVTDTAAVIKVERLATQVDDTLTTDAAVIGVELIFAT